MNSKQKQRLDKILIALEAVNWLDWQQVDRVKTYLETNISLENNDSKLLKSALQSLFLWELNNSKFQLNETYKRTMAKLK